MPRPDEESATREPTEDVSTTRDTGAQNTDGERRNREPGAGSAGSEELELERE
ncbi:MAG: hypothetical protein J07HX64_02893 [halophilic archaeon J07HX64]|nr:MAG: hypothetical protein J07HX64_02893 [halophilic archaeon J07HX64]